MATIKKIKDSDGNVHDIVDTHYTSLNVTGPASGTLENLPANTNNVYFNHIEQMTSGQRVVKSSHKITGRGTVSVASNANGDIIITGTDTNVDTKNTAGITAAPTTDNKANLYLIGAKTPDDSTQTYAQTHINSNVYVDVINGEILYVPKINASGRITALEFYESSDERLKTFTDDYDIDLDNIKNIKTGKFYWNSDENQVINGGVSAQTVEEYFPELVREDKNGFKSVNYDGLAVVAIAAIKKLTERIEHLENIINNK